jgi:ergothioneine biosynthesis protein EgtB
LLSRPSLDEVRTWRARVDERVLALLAHGEEAALAVVLLGTHHEEQHQELLLTDAKHALAANPLRPAYDASAPADATAGSIRAPAPLDWVRHEGRVAWIGHEGPAFAFDNEGPRHRTLVDAFDLATRLVTNGEYLRFVEDGGYERPELWLSDGWAAATAEGWKAPLYWERGAAGWNVFTFRGMQPLASAAPVTHASLYEADAYARWAGHRLPTEAEWEIAATGRPIEGNFVESGRLSAGAGDPARDDGELQLFGDAWEWTASAYLPYPKYRPVAGALGEYNGKFMSGQMVLRGGSCLSPQAHLRATYRNFFPPHARWQATGIRLARDA